MINTFKNNFLKNRFKKFMICSKNRDKSNLKQDTEQIVKNRPKSTQMVSLSIAQKLLKSAQ